MKLFAWRWLAISSVLCTALAYAETRPQYGGTLHLAMHASPQSLDPAEASQPDSFARRTLARLLFDGLVTIDDSGRVKPALAESWQTSRNQRWQFRLRRGVTFDDGTPLSAEIAAASLRFANSSWNIIAEGETLVIDLKTPDAGLLAELALPRNAIAKRDSENRISGTGPFHAAEWQPGKKLKLVATENYWDGRPFLDAVEIEMARDFRDQMTAMDLGRADLIEVAPEQTRRVSQSGRQLASSPPGELLALVFTRDFSAPEEKALREALSLSVDRGAIRSVLMQGTGQPTPAILPMWMSGYGFVFPVNTDLSKARQLRAQVHTVPTWRLGYDSTDAISRLIAERVALNARDAGLALQPVSSGASDVRLVRIPLASSDPWIALGDFAARIGVSSIKYSAGGAEELYAAEQSLLATERVIPLLDLPATYAAAAKLKSWSVRIDGSLDLCDAWLEAGTP